MAWGRCRAYVITFFSHILSWPVGPWAGVIFPIFHVCENHLVCPQPAMNIEDRTIGPDPALIQGGGGGQKCINRVCLYIDILYIKYNLRVTQRPQIQ